MGVIPQNLKSMWNQETAIQQWAEVKISKRQALVDGLEFIENLMNVIDLIRQCDNRSSRRFALTSLLVRAFDDMGSSTREAVTGNYRFCAMKLRDLLETNFLLDYLMSENGRPELWLNASTKEEFKKYKPYDIRIALDHRDRELNPTLPQKSNREKMYKMLSELGTHPGRYGSELSRDGGKMLQSGPFKQEDTLNQCLEESFRISALYLGIVCKNAVEVGIENTADFATLSLQSQKITEKYF